MDFFPASHDALQPWTHGPQEKTIANLCNTVVLHQIELITYEMSKIKNQYEITKNFDTTDNLLVFV